MNSSACREQLTALLEAHNARISSANDFLLDGLLRRRRCEQAEARAAKVRGAIADLVVDKSKRALLEHVLSQKLTRCRQ